MIEDVGTILTEATQSVLPMLLPKPMEISMKGIKDWQPQAFDEPIVLITTNFTDGPSGSAYFLIETRNTSVIVDLMLGGEGATDRRMNEESVDAIKEVMNQVLGVTASSLREKFDSPFGFEQVEIHSLEAQMDLGLLLDDDETSMVEIELTIEGLDPLTLMSCFPKDTVGSMGDSPAEPAAKAPEPAGDTDDVPTMPEPAAADDSNEIALPGMAPPGVVEEAPPSIVPEAAEDGDHPLPRNIELIIDIELPIVIRLGATEMSLKDVMRLGPGAIIELNKAVDEPVEMLVNDKTIAKGEVVVVEGNFAFRVTDIKSKETRIESLS